MAWDVSQEEKTNDKERWKWKEREKCSYKTGSAENNMHYAADMDKIQAWIDKINPAMPLRGNACVVQGWQGVDLVEGHQRLWGRESGRMNVKTIGWETSAKSSHGTRMRLSSILSNSTHFTHYTALNELKFAHICGHTKKIERTAWMSIHRLVTETPIYLSFIRCTMMGNWLQPLGRNPWRVVKSRCGCTILALWIIERWEKMINHEEMLSWSLDVAISTS